MEFQVFLLVTYKVESHFFSANKRIALALDHKDLQAGAAPTFRFRKFWERKRCHWKDNNNDSNKITSHLSLVNSVLHMKKDSFFYQYHLNCFVISYFVHPLVHDHEEQEIGHRKRWLHLGFLY